MTDTKRLRDAIQASGLKISFLAEKMGISRQALQQKIDNDSEFKASEIAALAGLLGLDIPEKEAIFFCS
ncbi:helix-turn-helix transcriptional regulator [Subdoligranulum variabile]|uniref:helix-turn-helix domain-containing protein n=1 Tax=Subdoligranulum variabile TaxID=214851 RepID=UPI0026EB3D07|nr:helix-turn-helix transcriptional regulator [Subdoligranulum variabile]